MYTQTKLMKGFIERLFTLLDESSEIFVLERPFLLKKDIADHQIFHPDYVFVPRTQAETDRLRSVNELETKKVLDALEKEFESEEIKQYREPVQQVFSVLDPVAESVRKEVEKEEAKLFQLLDK